MQFTDQSTPNGIFWIQNVLVDSVLFYPNSITWPKLNQFEIFKALNNLIFEININFMQCSDQSTPNGIFWILWLKHHKIWLKLKSKLFGVQLVFEFFKGPKCISGQDDFSPMLGCQNAMSTFLNVQCHGQVPPFQQNASSIFNAK